MGLLVAILGFLGGLLLLGAAAHASCRCRAVADYGPVWSPDDSAIAYTQAYESAHVVSLASGSDIVTAAPTPSVVYSQDWSMAAAVVSDGAPDYSLVVFRPDGTDIRRLDRAFQTPPAWSPSGDQVAYVGADEGLYVIRPDGSDRRLIAAHAYPYGARAASWSPDGSLLAFVSGKDVFVIALDGGEARNVTVGLDGTHVDPAWSPRGDALAIVTNFGAAFDFVGSDGTPLFRLESELPVAQGGISLSWSPDGEKLLYSYRFTPTQGSPGIYEIDTSARTQRLVSPFGIEASYSHDGTRIAFGGSVTIEPNPPNKIDCVGVGIWTVKSDGGGQMLVTRTCKDTPPTLSIHAPDTLDYGRTATLSGSALAGSSPSVLVSSRPCGGSASSRIAPVAGGAWLETVAPKVTTEYTVEAAADQVRATVRVMPVVTLRQTGRLAFQVKVRAAQSFVGRSVLVELTSGKTGNVVVRRRLLLGSAARSGAAVVTTGRFRLAATDVHPWESLSVALPKRSTGPCLEPAVSDPIAVSQR